MATKKKMTLKEKWAEENKEYIKNRHRGRPKAFGSPAEFWNLFEEYKKHVEANPIKKHDIRGKDATSVHIKIPKPYTMAGFECFSYDNGYPIDLEKYFYNEGGAYEDFRGVCKRARQEIREMQIAGGMSGMYNSSITQRLNNLAEVTRNTNTNNNNLGLELDVSKLSTEAIKQLLNATSKPTGDGPIEIKE